MMEAAVFYILAAVLVVSAVGCIVTGNIVRMAVCLFGALGAIAMFYFLLGAYFLGVIQLIVYVGGILVVIVFGIMLTMHAPGARFAVRRIDLIAGALVGVVLLSGLVVSLTAVNWEGLSADRSPGYTTAAIGKSLLTTYLLPFELISVLLLAAMIGAAFLARREKRTNTENR